MTRRTYRVRDGRVEEVTEEQFRAERDGIQFLRDPDEEVWDFSPLAQRFKTMRIEGVLSDHPVLIHPDGRREPLFVFGTWYPIAEAPKDVTLLCSDGEDDPFFGCWVPLFQKYMARDDGINGDRVPLWFMPLPPPPEKKNP